jgi:hypothetical protein
MCGLGVVTGTVSKYQTFPDLYRIRNILAMDRLMAIDAPDPEDDGTEPDIDDLDPVDAADQKVQDHTDDRAWVKTCLDVITTASQAAESDLVRSALDSLGITAAARISRILRSDQTRKG